MTKNILCFGDSNTWGAEPVTDHIHVNRYPRDIRWPGMLADTLGSDIKIIEEGLNGRTTIWDDPIEGYKNGKEYLIPCLESHQPLDLVIIFLGTNDLKHRFSLTAFDVARSAGVLVKTVMNWIPVAGQRPEVLLIAPPPFKPVPEFLKLMFSNGYEKSKGFSKEFKEVSIELGCGFLDAGEYIESSSKDGIHLDPNAHVKLGKVIAKKVVEIFN